MAIHIELQRRTRNTLVLMLALGGLASVWASPAQGADSEKSAAPYRSPWGMAVSPDGSTIYVSDATAGCVEALDRSGKPRHPAIALQGTPQGLCLSPDGAVLYVAERGAGTVAVIDTAAAAVRERIPAGRWPVALALAPQRGRLFVCNQDRHTVSAFDLAQTPPRLVAEIPVVREPSGAAVTPDERFLVVANQLPLGPSTDAKLAADVSILDIEKSAAAATIKLPPGSSLVHGVCVSPDGRWAYVVHGVGHFNLPMTQLERGWVNTYAVSIIDIAQKTRLATLLLDDLMQGAADPFAVVSSADGAQLWICHTGVHEVSAIEIARVHLLLAGHIPDDLAKLKDGSLPNIWVRIQEDRGAIEELTYDLTALYLAGAIRRIPSGGKGPRGLALTPDGQTLLVANYFSGSVAAIDTAKGQLQDPLWQAPQPEASAARRGELLFHDATHSFQRWHSCATCHPNDGRIDGLRWDFADDGMGNGMNTPTVLYPHETEPLHRQGTLATTRVLAQHGLTFTHMVVPTDEQVDDLVAYMTSLHSEPSPHLAPDGNLTPAAQRGQAIFEGKAQCAGCHSGPRLTDRKLYDVGIGDLHSPGAKFKSTPLAELHRTAPYLHDGRAVTLHEVLTTHNPKDEHGKTQELSQQELDDLVAYLLSL